MDPLEEEDQQHDLCFSPLSLVGKRLILRRAEKQPSSDESALPYDLPGR